MKQVLLILLLSIFIFSCKDDDKNLDFDKTTLEKSITMDSSPGSQIIQAIGVSAGDVTIDQSWVTIEINNGLMTIKTTQNEEVASRTAKLTIKKGSEVSILRVVQAGFDGDSYGTKVAMGGNSFISTKVASESVADAGVLNWTNANTIISTFAKVTTPGKLRVFLKYKADAEGNVITFTQGTNTFDVTLSKPTFKSDTITYLGEIDVEKAGYLKMDLQGKTLIGTTFARPSDFIFLGDASANMVYVKNEEDYYFGRRGPSVHMQYTLPSTDVEWFYNEVTVPVGYDPIGSYFMTCGFQGGYFGMQVNSATERKIFFSVWSTYVTDNPYEIPEDEKVIVSKKGEGVITQPFGGEGSGTQSILSYQWKTGDTYKFIVHIRPLGTGYSEFTGYFYDNDTSEWRLVAQLLRPKTSTYVVTPYSFLENFNKDQGHLQRKVYYNNQWAYTADGNWVELTACTFTGDAIAKSGQRLDYAGGVENNSFYLKNTGFFDDNVTLNQDFTRIANGSQPTVELDALTAIES